jgi:hypothetical protein
MQMNNLAESGKRRKIIADLILIFCVVLVALSVFLVAFLKSEDGVFVSVRIGDGESVMYSLSEDGEYKILGGKNILVIKDGKAYMSHADCPDKTCVRTGAISKTGEQIICLPNRVYISIIGAEETL